MANRLAEASSPYLLQHAENPIDWWPWTPDAFAEARRRDVPWVVVVSHKAPFSASAAVTSQTASRTASK